MYGRRRVASECDRTTDNLSFKVSEEYDDER